MRRVVVTGLGLVCPFGLGVEHGWNCLLNGGSGLVSLKERPGFGNLPCTVAGVVPEKENDSKDFVPHLFDWDSVVKRSERRQISRSIAFALKAADEAWCDARLEGSDRERVGVAVGMGVVDLDDVHSTGHMLDQGKYSRVSPYFVPRMLTNMAAGHISIKYGLHGPNHSVSTACATGAHSVGDAFNFIRWGYAEAMVCGSAEACVSPIAVGGFSRCRALSTKFNDRPTESSRPFDELRDGFVMGEGAGILILESLAHAEARGVKKVYGEVIGYGLSSDGFHVTSPDEEGHGAQLCMERALADATVPPESVGYVNAHATSTPVGDGVEAKAIERVFGPVAVSSTKGAVGHLLGAAGSVEAVFTILAVSRAQIPHTANLNRTELTERLNFVKDKPETWQEDERIALSNSFGFGGTNATLCFRSFM